MKKICPRCYHTMTRTLQWGDWICRDCGKWLQRGEGE